LRNFPAHLKINRNRRAPTCRRFQVKRDISEKAQ
jgi:hypothetical protein